MSMRKQRGSQVVNREIKGPPFGYCAFPREVTRLSWVNNSAGEDSTLSSSGMPLRSVHGHQPSARQEHSAMVRAVDCFSGLQPTSSSLSSF